MALPPPTNPDWSQPVTPPTGGLTDDELQSLSRWIMGPVMRDTPLVKAITKLVATREANVMREANKAYEAHRVAAERSGELAANIRENPDRFKVSRAMSLANEWDLMYKAVPGLQLGANHAASELRARLNEEPTDGN